MAGKLSLEQIESSEEEKDRYDRGTRQIMLALLEDAIGSYLKSGIGTPALEDAEDWLFISPDETWSYSFLSICHVLGLDPDATRKAIRSMRDKGQRKAPRLRLNAGEKCQIAEPS